MSRSLAAPHGPRHSNTGGFRRVAVLAPHGWVRRCRCCPVRRGGPTAVPLRPCASRRQCRIRRRPRPPAGVPPRSFLAVRVRGQLRATVLIAPLALGDGAARSVGAEESRSQSPPWLRIPRVSRCTISSSERRVTYIRLRPKRLVAVREQLHMRPCPSGPHPIGMCAPRTRTRKSNTRAERCPD